MMRREQKQDGGHGPFQGLAWLWPMDAPSPPTLIQFRLKITRPVTAENAGLWVGADSNFQAFVNGILVGRHQFSDAPSGKTVRKLPVSPLHDGCNVIAIEVYYRGGASLEYEAGAPGLAVCLEGVSCEADGVSDWRCRAAPEFRHGDRTKVTAQMGHVMTYDLRRRDDWAAIGYDDATWSSVVPTRPPRTIFERPILPLYEADPTPVRVCAVTPARCDPLAADEPVAVQMMRDVLGCATPVGLPGVPARSVDAGPVLTLPCPSPPHDAIHAVLDLGREETGLLTVDVDASAGTVLDIGHGEHWDGARVPVRIGTRNFADRFILAEGRNRFTLAHRRLGARFLELRVRGHSQPVRVHQVGLIPVHYPVDQVGRFVCDAAGQQDARAMAVRTLDLCMHEHYEDCPWREQALYGGDGMIEAAIGYYVFDNPEFSAASLRLLGDSRRADGLLELTAPGKWDRTIPSFSLMWIQAVRDYHLFAGRDDLTNDFLDPILAMLRRQLATPCENGLLSPPGGANYWHFYDWADQTAGRIVAPDGHIVDPGEAIDDALFNMHVLMAIEAACDLLHYVGHEAEALTWRGTASGLRKAIQTVFWQAAEGGFRTYAAGGHPFAPTLTATAMALACGAIPEADRTAVASWLGRSEELMRASWMTRWFACRGMMQADPARYATVWIDLLANEAHRMRESGGDTLWETPRGAADFDGAGSLCHGWAALIAYIQSAWVLGVRPLKPGYETFVFSPQTAGLSHAAGRVPTPAGSLDVEWRLKGETFEAELRGPSSLKPFFRPPVNVKKARATWNGVRLDPAVKNEHQ